MADSNITATIKEGVLIVKMPLEKKPQPSGSGKNLTVASTRGNMRLDVEYQGKPITIGINAYIPNN